MNVKTKNDNTTILENDKDWNYYETDKALCIGKFICGNGNCVDKSKVHFILLTLKVNKTSEHIMIISKCFRNVMVIMIVEIVVMKLNVLKI